MLNSRNRQSDHVTCLPSDIKSAIFLLSFGFCLYEFVFVRDSFELKSFQRRFLCENGETDLCQTVAVCSAVSLIMSIIINNTLAKIHK